MIMNNLISMVENLAGVERSLRGSSAGIEEWIIGAQWRMRSGWSGDLARTFTFVWAVVVIVVVDDLIAVVYSLLSKPSKTLPMKIL
jgi:hypothetical protein